MVQSNQRSSIFLITVLGMPAIFFLHKVLSKDKEGQKTDGLNFRQAHTVSVLSNSLLQLREQTPLSFKTPLIY